MADEQPNSTSNKPLLTNTDDDRPLNYQDQSSIQGKILTETSNKESENKSTEQDRHEYESVRDTKETGTLGRNCLERTFRHYNNSTMRSGIMTLILTAKGVGCLSIPYTYAFIGMVPATIILIISCLNMIFSFYLQTRVQIRNKECNLYSDLVGHVLGPKNRIFLSIILWFAIAGAVISYHLTAKDFFMNCFGPLVARSVGISEAMYNNPNDQNVYWFKEILILIELLGSSLLILPIALPKVAGDFLRGLYLFPIVAILYIIVVMIAQAPSYIAIEDNAINMFSGNIWDYLQNVGILVYGYNCIGNYHYVYRQIKNPSKRRLDKIDNRSMIILQVIYLPIGTIAYLSYGDMLARPESKLFPNRPGIPGYSDYAMLIGRILMIPACWISLLVNLFPLKDETFTLFKMKRTYCSELIVTCLCLFGGSIIGWAYPNVTDWFALLGAFTGAFLNVYFPAQQFLKQFSNAPKRKWLYIFTILWMAIMLIILLSSAVVVSIGIVKNIINRS